MLREYGVGSLDVGSQPFLRGGGEMGALMRAHDWSTSPLGDPSRWPEALSSVVGLLLNSKFPMFVAWGENLGFLYNDAYAAILGEKHPKALGARFFDIWSEIWGDIGPLIDAAMAGEAIYREDLPLLMNRTGRDEQTWFTFSYSPVRDRDGSVAGMFCACAETTGKVLAESRLGFLVTLGDALQAARTPSQVKMSAAEALGRQLRADRAGYGEIVGDGEVVMVERDWTASGVASLSGEARLLDGFGPAVIAELRAGRTLVVEDCEADPRTADPKFLRTWASIGTRALVVTPLLRDDRLSAILYVHSRTPRHWEGHEIALVGDVATRTWSAHSQALAEAAQADSEARLRRAHQAARLGDFTWDLTTDATTLSEQYEGLLAKPCDQLPRTGEQFFALVHADDLGPLLAAADPVLRGHAARFDTEYRVRRGDGEVVWWAAHAEGEDQRPEGGPVRIVGVNYDVTERKKAEEALRESESRFRNMADAAPVMLWVTDQSGYCVYLNRSWYSFTGQTPSEAEGYGWLDATHPDDREMAERVFRDANENRSPFRIEYRLRRADGAYRWCIDAAAPRLGADGEHLGYIGSVIDIDERREAERLQRESESRLRMITNTLPAFVWFATPDGELHYFNDRWYEYTGQTPETALPSGWTQVLHPEDAEPVSRAWAEARAHGRDYEIECRYRRSDGAHRWYMARAMPLKDEAGRITAWVGSSTDVHEHVVAEAQQTLLINELNHRVKNTLATVQALASQAVAPGESVMEYRKNFEARLMSLSAAHDILTATSWEGASLQELVLRVLRPWEDRDRFLMTGPSAWLSPRQALSVALALHELATNAVKHGALSVADGRVMLDWSATGGVLRMQWREVGGPPVEPPQRRGFGSRLLERGIGRELGAEAVLEFRSTGVEYQLNLPFLDESSGARSAQAEQ
jgi:PAS domain S-box-containing protein